MSNSPPLRKRIRLDAALYSDPSVVCSITVTTANRARFFEDRSLAEACMNCLIARASAAGVTLHAYCLMPDHLHLLVSPTAGGSLIDLLRDIKGETTRLAWKHGHPGRVWQRSFFDHFLRRDEDLERAIRYILENPVRARMVSEPEEYEFSGPRC